MYYRLKVYSIPMPNPSGTVIIAITGPQIKVCNRKLFSYFSTKTYVVGTQKNPLNETVLLSTKNKCLN